MKKIMSLFVIIALLGGVTLAYAKSITLDARELSSDLCIIIGGSGSNTTTDAFGAISEHVGKELNKPQVENWEIVQYLNQHRDEMTCGSGFVEKNWMMVALDKARYNEIFSSLFVEILYDDDERTLVNVNAVAYTGPGHQPETVLDYIDGYIIRKRHNKIIVRESKELRDMLIEDFGALRFDELPESEQQRYLANKPG